MVTAGVVVDWDVVLSLLVDVDVGSDVVVGSAVVEVAAGVVVSPTVVVVIVGLYQL